MTRRETTGTAESAAIRRELIGAGLWLAISLSAIAVFAVVANEFAMAVGVALHGTPDIEARVTDFWVALVVVGVLVAACAVAIATRRWIALSLAIIVLAVAGFLALGIFGAIRHTAWPADESRAPVELPCQCYSGSDCDCPGG